MQPGAEIGPTFPKPREVLSGRPCRPLREQLDRQGQAGGWVGGCPPGFLEEALGVPEIRMHFPESGSSCGRPCLLLGAGPGGGRGGRAAGTQAACSCPVLPAAACLTTSLSSRLRPAAWRGADGPTAAPWPRRWRPGLPSRWVACTSMHIYLGSALVVIGQLVEVFIVPFFTLMNNVHRENMQTQKKIING